MAELEEQAGGPRELAEDLTSVRWNGSPAAWLCLLWNCRHINQAIIKALPISVPPDQLEIGIVQVKPKPAYETYCSAQRSYSVFNT